MSDFYRFRGRNACHNRTDAPPILAHELRYYADPEFRELFDASAKSAVLAVR